RQSVADPRQRIRDRVLLLLVPLQVEIEDLRQQVMLHRAGQQHLERIAQKRARVLVVQELGVLGEDGTLLRLFDVGLEPDESILPCRMEHLVQRFQQLDKRFIAQWMRAEQGSDRRNSPFEYRKWVGHYKRTEDHPADDDELG